MVAAVIVHQIDSSRGSSSGPKVEVLRYPKSCPGPPRDAPPGWPLSFLLTNSPNHIFSSSPEAILPTTNVTLALLFSLFPRTLWTCLYFQPPSLNVYFDSALISQEDFLLSPLDTLIVNLKTHFTNFVELHVALQDKSLFPPPWGVLTLLSEDLSWLLAQSAGRELTLLALSQHSTPAIPQLSWKAFFYQNS